MTYQEIAEEMGCALSTAYKAVQRALERDVTEGSPIDEDWRNIELKRLDYALAGLQRRIAHGDTRAVEKMLLIQRQRERYLPASRTSEKSWGPNRKAMEESIKGIDDEPPAVVLQMARSMADAVDADPKNAQLWRTYRETVEALMGGEDAAAEDDPIAQIPSCAPVGHLKAV